MTDFFDDLERELRQAHRRDTETHARSRVFVRPRLSGFAAGGLRMLLAFVVAALVGLIVMTVGREADFERPAVAPRPSPTGAPGALGGCAPSDYWKAPIVDEPIPQAITSRFALFRDHPRPTGELPRDLRNVWGAKKLYMGALTLRPRLDTGARLRVVLVAADVTNADVGPRRDPDLCGPPPDPITAGICVAAFPPNGTKSEAACFSIQVIEDAEAWVGVTRQTVFGLAPDGAERVTFDTPAGTQSLHISQNVYAGDMRSALNPHGTNPGFTP